MYNDAFKIICTPTVNLLRMTSSPDGRHLPSKRIGRGRAIRSELSVQVGEGPAGGLQFRFEGGDPGGLLGARLLDYLVDRGGEVLMQFLSRAGDGGGRDREVSCWPGARTHSARPVVS